MSSDFAIAPLVSGDWERVRAIYREGIDTGNATFETEVPAWEAWDAAHLPVGRLVARLDGEIAGFAALSPVSRRRVYAGVAEASVYVAASARGRGAGRALLEAVIAESERAGIWTLQSGTFPENAPSIALQKACGFREVGRRERLGSMNGRWRDVILLERRSAVAGAENRAVMLPRGFREDP
ncbi:MAG TPA: GNAT family N-acetyltransferase [Thermoanaerobaculia bacterium]|nr:GNAT family N-acetyltransferase [Thermoanaerobaculia bacterium]